jgi:acetyltransferase-like isoleucine patch superfamily enzyme
MSETDYKVKDAISAPGKSAFRAYRDIYYGDTSLWYVIKSELITTLTCGLSGAVGLFLRQMLYPCLFKQCGRKVVFGKNMTLRHAHKISLGHRVILDDQTVLDAKGEDNEGIVLEDDVYVGRNTIIYCKNGNITLENQVNISSNCQLFSSNELRVGAQTVIAAFTYLLSGGQYDIRDRATPFAKQSGMITRGSTVIGPNCWLGAGVVVVDGVKIGSHCVIGAGAVVTKDVPDDYLATGVPATHKPLP